MQLKITNAGIAAATQAAQGGYVIKIATYKLGSGVNYTPVNTDTTLHGTVVNSGAVTSVTQGTQPNEVSVKIVLNQTIGNFNFGEFGLFLDNGTLFALGSYPALQNKTKASGSNPGNVININCTLMISTTTPVIAFDGANVGSFTSVKVSTSSTNTAEIKLATNGDLLFVVGNTTRARIKTNGQFIANTITQGNPA